MTSSKSPKEKSKQQVFLFAPFSGIWVHSFAENQLLRQIDENLFNLSIVRCGTLFKQFCTVMEARGPTLEDSEVSKLKTCSHCMKKSKSLRSEKKNNSLLIDNYIYTEDKIYIDEILRGVNHKNFMDFNFHGIEAGRLSLYETLIKFKKISTNLSKSEFDYYCRSLHNYLLTVIATDRLLMSHGTPIGITYSPQYAVNNAFLEVLRKKGGKGYLIEGSSNINERYSHLRIWDWDKYKLLNPAIENWTATDSSFSLTRKDISRVDSHFGEIKKKSSFSTYSGSRYVENIRKHYGISENSKIFLCVLSSLDEVYSAYICNFFPQNKYKSVVFGSQFDWIRDTILWVTSKKDICLIIRQHPRDFPNKRDSHKSEQADLWNKLLANLPSNVFVDSGNSQVDLESYWTDVDLVITGWSSVALEALWNNIAVLTYDANLPSYPGNTHITGYSKSDYFKNLDLVRSQKPAIHKSIVYSWLHYNFNEGTIFHDSPLSYKIIKKINIFRVLFFYIDKYFPILLGRIDLIFGSKKISGKKINEILIKKFDSLYDLNN